MPTLNIKDPEVYRLARELADERHTSMTEVVRSALIAERERRPSRPRRMTVEEMDDLGRRVRARMEAAGERFLTDDDLYDEMGLPQ